MKISLLRRIGRILALAAAHISFFEKRRKDFEAE